MRKKLPLSPHLTVTSVLFIVYHRKQVVSMIQRCYQLHTQLKAQTLHKTEVCAYVGEDNPFIHHGHRPTPLPTSKCLQSIGEYHNETFNIWSHFVAMIYFSYQLGVHVRYSKAKRVTLPMQLFTSATCFGISAIAHTFNHHSESISKRLFDVDRAGIAFMLMGNSLSVGAIHFDNPRIRWIYFVAAVISAMLTAKRVTADECSPQGKLQAFCMQMLISFWPIGCELWQTPSFWEHPDTHRFVKDALWTYFWGGLGGVLFAGRIPERYFPGHFDFFGNGHQLMHICGFISAAIAYSGCKRYHKWKWRVQYQ